MYTYHFQFATTGGAGASASPALTEPYGGNVSTKLLSGKVRSVYVKYNTQAATTDLVLKTLGKNGPSQTILTLTDKNTDGLFYPLVAQHDNLGVVATWDGTHPILEPAVIDDYLCVTVAQGNDKTMDVWVVVEC